MVEKGSMPFNSICIARLKQGIKKMGLALSNFNTAKIILKASSFVHIPTGPQLTSPGQAKRVAQLQARMPCSGYFHQRCVAVGEGHLAIRHHS